jgi:hypothetical protein
MKGLISIPTMRFAPPVRRASQRSSTPLPQPTSRSTSPGASCATSMSLPTTPRYPALCPRASRLPIIPNAGPLRVIVQWCLVSWGSSGSHWEGATLKGNSTKGDPVPCTWYEMPSTSPVVSDSATARVRCCWSMRARKPVMAAPISAVRSTARSVYGVGLT